jgi:hypothetical protein
MLGRQSGAVPLDGLIPASEHRREQDHRGRHVMPRDRVVHLRAREHAEDFRPKPQLRPHQSSAGSVVGGILHIDHPNRPQYRKQLGRLQSRNERNHGRGARVARAHDNLIWKLSGFRPCLGEHDESDGQPPPRGPRRPSGTSWRTSPDPDQGRADGQIRTSSTPQPIGDPRDRCSGCRWFASIEGLPDELRNRNIVQYPEPFSPIPLGRATA